MVCIKTGSSILEEKAKGILWLLNGGGWEEVERGLGGLWRMSPGCGKWGHPGLEKTFLPCGSPVCIAPLLLPNLCPSPVCQAWSFKGDFFSPFQLPKLSSSSCCTDRQHRQFPPGAKGLIWSSWHHYLGVIPLSGR